MRVTVVTPYLPHHRIGHGGGVSIRNMIAWLARSHTVTVVALLRPNEHQLVAGTAADLGVDIRTVDFLDETASGSRQLKLLLQRGDALLRSQIDGRPYYVQKYGSPALTRKVCEAVAESRPDAVQIEYLQMALITRQLRIWRDDRLSRGREAPGLFCSSHELGSLPRARQAAASQGVFRSRLLDREAAAWRRLERDATHWADRTFCVTDQDRDLLIDQGGVNCRTIPLGVDTDAVRPIWTSPDNQDLLFVGSFAHKPNRLTADRLVSRLWPDIAAAFPDARLILAGRGSDDYLNDLSDPPQRVSATGYLDSLDQCYRDSRLFIAPLPTGGGIKIKILEAMAAGIPIVTTNVGAEGIVTDAEQAMWIADSDEGFRGAVAEALGDPDGAADRATTARRIIEDRFSWSAITRILEEEYALFQAR
jgi:glycosyltransferase involved in cell wall biosynthesis